MLVGDSSARSGSPIHFIQGLRCRHQKISCPSFAFQAFQRLFWRSHRMDWCAFHGDDSSGNSGLVGVVQYLSCLCHLHYSREARSLHIISDICPGTPLASHLRGWSKQSGLETILQGHCYATFRRLLSPLPRSAGALPSPLYPITSRKSHVRTTAPPIATKIV